jgi:membrane fusion protein (multidrug efflux system)
MEMIFRKLSVAASLLALALLSLNCGGDSNADTTAKNKEAERSITVHAQEIQPKPFTETLQLSGTIKAYDDIKLSPEEGGVVKVWKYEKGQSVSRGSIIVVLNDDVAKPSYEAALAQYKSSELTFDKQQKVYSEQAVSEWQLKTTEYTRDAAKAQSALMHARWERTRIRTPIDGILDERYIDEGEMASPGVAIARIVNISRVKIQVEVPERYAGTIRPGTPIELTVQAYPGQTFSGKVSYIGATINPDNRTFPTESVIPNPRLRLKPEMIAKVKLAQSSEKEALLIDEEIVQQLDRDRLVVYVVNGGKAEERIVQLGGRKANLVEVVSGLKSGEMVITSGYQSIINGQAVVVEK